MAPLFQRFIKEDGLLIVSGIIQSRAHEVTDQLQAVGFSVEELREDNDWVAAICRLKEHL